MGILGITNRSENWKTVENVYGLDDGAKVRLVRQLGESKETQAGNIRIELFWYGVRDWANQNSGTKGDYSRDFSNRYNRLFPDLRKRIEEFKGFQDLKPHNYTVSEEDHLKLYNNIDTEIDIILETPSRLFIGEAKRESEFGTEGGLILVHQLIRQYVMASILVELTAIEGYAKKKIVPFVVGDKIDSLMNVHQVRFMIKQHNCSHSPGEWLRQENVLSWDCIRAIANPESTHDCTRSKCQER